MDGFKEEKKEKRSAALSSLSLSRCLVIHAFMSSVHELSSLVRLVTSLRGGISGAVCHLRKADDLLLLLS